MGWPRGENFVAGAFEGAESLDDSPLELSSPRLERSSLIRLAYRLFVVKAGLDKGPTLC